MPFACEQFVYWTVERKGITDRFGSQLHRIRYLEFWPGRIAEDSRRPAAYLPDFNWLPLLDSKSAIFVVQTESEAIARCAEGFPTLALDRWLIPLELEPFDWNRRPVFVWHKRLVKLFRQRGADAMVQKSGDFAYLSSLYAESLLPDAEVAATVDSV